MQCERDREKERYIKYFYVGSFDKVHLVLKNRLSSTKQTNVAKFEQVFFKLVATPG